MADDEKIELPKLTSAEVTNPILKYIYQIILVASLGLNVVFSVMAYRDKSRLSELEIEKHTIENRLLVAEHLPAFSSFRLIYDIGALDKFLRSHEQPPFLNGNRIYRFLENDAYLAAKSDLGNLKKGRTSSRVTFLILANTHDSTAYAVTANSNLAGC